MKLDKKIIRCKYCDTYCKGTMGYGSHLMREHSEILPQDMDEIQLVYYAMTGKTHGNCVMCKKPTKWNEKSMKYHRFCDDPACKEKYRELFKKRMIGKYNKVTLLDDPQWQRIMLSKRKNSKTYVWSDRSVTMEYFGTYELDALRFFDTLMNWDPSDIMSPSPHTYYYVYEGKRHFYIPDFFIPSLNCEIEIKDGGDNPNNHPKIQAVDKVKEQRKDEVMSRIKGVDYVKITNRDYNTFMKYLEKKKEQLIDPVTPTNIVVIGK